MLPSTASASTQRGNAPTPGPATLPDANPSRTFLPAVLLLLLATNALLRLTVALRPLEYIDGLTIPDDAYLSLTIARNIAHGMGPLYGLEFTNGFQPLYVFLLVPVFWLAHGNAVAAPVHAALLLLTLFDTAALYLLFRSTSTWSTSRITPILVGAAWVFNPYVMATTLNGLETSVSCFFILLTIFLYERHAAGAKGPLPTPRALLLGAVLGLAVLARIDNVFLALTTIALIVWRSEANGPPRRRLVATLATVSGAGLVVNLPWLIYSFRYTGDIYPVSGKAVRFMSLANVSHAPTLANLYIPLAGDAIQVIARHHASLLLVTLALLCILFVTERRRALEPLKERIHALSLPCLFGLCLVLAYVGYIFTPWFFDRYLFPLTIPVLTCFAVVADSCLSRMRTTRRQLVLAALVLTAVVGASALGQEFQDLFSSRDSKTLGYMNLGLWAKEHFPDGTVVGGSQTGALAYFAPSLTVINLDGVVNKSCFESLVQRRNMEYIRGARVQYVIGWPVNLGFIARHSSGFRKEDLQLVTKIEGFRTFGHQWYVLRVTPPAGPPPRD